MPRPRYSYPVGDSEVPCRFVSVSCSFPAGDTCETRAGIPKLSDCPDMGAVVPWFERRSLSSSRKSEIFERLRLGVQTWRPIDILLGLKGEDSHARTAPRWVGSFRFVEGPGRMSMLTVVRRKCSRVTMFPARVFETLPSVASRYAPSGN